MITQDRITQLLQQCADCLDSACGDSMLSLKASELKELCRWAGYHQTMMERNTVTSDHIVYQQEGEGTMARFIWKGPE